MTSYHWTTPIKAIYEKAVKVYQSGNHDLDTYFSTEEIETLAKVGLKPIHVFDYAEDFSRNGEPDWETFILVAAARRDFFLHEQFGVTNTEEFSADKLPPKVEAYEGLEWLPRIIRKAQCFLEGGLCHDIMYGCGGDRRFLKEQDVHPADFLRITWASRWDPAKVLAYLQKNR